MYFVWHKSHHEDRRLYKHIHTVHHQYHAPFVFVTQYAHPSEIFAVSIFSMLGMYSCYSYVISQCIAIAIALPMMNDE